MARKPRIEYLGALYLVMARGDRRERIVHDEIDRYSLVKTLGEAAVKGNRNYQTSQMGRDHAQDEAEKVVRIGLKKYKLKKEALDRLPGSDERKVAIAESIHRNTTVSQAWIAERLRMKSAANVSQQLGRKREPERASVRQRGVDPQSVKNC